MALDQLQIENYIRRHRMLAAAIDEMKAEMSNIAALVGAEMTVGQVIDVDGVPAVRTAGRREFSLPLAVAALTPEERAQCLKNVFDKDEVRELVKAKGLLDSVMEDVGNPPGMRFRG